MISVKLFCPILPLASALRFFNQIKSWGQFHRICAWHLKCRIGSSLTKMSLSINRGRYCTSSIVGSRVYGYPLATSFTHYPIVWTVKSSVVGTRVLAVLKRGLLKHVTLNPTIYSILCGNSAGLVHVTNCLPSYRWGDYVAIVFWITPQFLLRDATEQM